MSLSLTNQARRIYHSCSLLRFLIPLNLPCLTRKEIHHRPCLVLLNGLDIGYTLDTISRLDDDERSNFQSGRQGEGYNQKLYPLKRSVCFLMTGIKLRPWAKGRQFNGHPFKDTTMMKSWYRLYLISGQNRETWTINGTRPLPPYYAESKERGLGVPALDSSRSSTSDQENRAIVTMLGFHLFPSFKTTVFFSSSLSREIVAKGVNRFNPLPLIRDRGLSLRISARYWR